MLQLFIGPITWPLAIMVIGVAFVTALVEIINNKGDKK